MHQVTIKNHRIKISFDKKFHGWIYVKEDIKYNANSYFDKMTKLYLPANLDHLSKVFKTYAGNEDFTFDDKFTDYLEKEMHDTALFETKRTLLKERVTLATIGNRVPLIDHQDPAPYKHQRVQLEYAVRFPGFYNLDEMGLGKTRVAIERYIFLKEKLKVVDKCIVVCPLSLVYNWQKEIKKWSDLSSLILIGSKKQKIELVRMFQDQVDFFIMNYEGIESLKKELPFFVNKKTNIILDEYIKIKNSTTNRSRNTIEICNLTDYVYAMCGTPVTQGSPDVFSPSLAVDKGKKYGLSQKIFIDKYFGRYGQRLVAKSRTHKELSDKLFENALRFTKKECLDLPDKLFTTIPVELPKENRDAYEQMATYLMTYINEKEEVTAPILLVQLLRLSQITSGFSKNVDNKIVEFKQQPKLDVLKELLEQNNSHQLIVWSRFVRDVKAIASLAKSMGMTYGCLVGKNQDEYKSDAQIEMQVQMVDNRLVVMPQITGSDGNKYSDIVIPNSPYQRNEIKDKFNKGDIQIIVGTAATGGLGLDLIGDQLDLENKEEVVIYYANDYSLLNRLQSEDRAHRSGQTKKVMYYDLIAQDTVDVGVMKIIFGKKAVADVITRDNLLKLMEGKDV